MSIRNVIQEGKETFVILSCEKQEVKRNHCGSLTHESYQINNILMKNLSIEVRQATKNTLFELNFPFTFALIHQFLIELIPILKF